MFQELASQGRVTVRPSAPGSPLAPRSGSAPPGPAPAPPAPAVDGRMAGPSAGPVPGFGGWDSLTMALLA